MNNLSPAHDVVAHQMVAMAPLARADLLAFTLFTKPDYEVNWHHRLLANKLTRFARGEIKRLIVSMPPRYGKSELVSRRLPAFLFGLNPHARIISASYGADLASRMNRDVQKIIVSPEYRFLFPHVRLNSSNVRSDAQGSFLRNNDIFEIVGHSGVYRSAGVGGAITGMGADFAIIDDPVKNDEEAESPVYRERAWDWFTSTLYTRREKGGGILITMTRWHEDDLAGRVIERMPGEWEVISFPALLDGAPGYGDPRSLGEPLWPNKYDLIDAMKTKRTVGSRVWQALYQQRPTAPEGGIIQRKWCKQFYTRLPDRVDEIIQSWDLTFKDGIGTDYVVGQVWARCGANKYLIDCVRDQLSFTDTIARIRALTACHPKAYVKLIEDAANGPAVINALQNEIPGIIAVKPDKSKTARMNAAAPDFEAGNVYLPHVSIAPWVHDFIEEVVNFPNAKQDDQCDAMTQALIRFREEASGDLTDDMVTPFRAPQRERLAW